MANQSQKKYNKMFQKAEELFWKYGYNNVSVDQIAKEAGISKMTIYKHFHSKEELFIEVLIKYTENHLNKLAEIIDEKYHTIEKVEAMYNYTLKTNSELTAVLIKDIMDKVHIMQKLVAYKEQRTLSIWRSIVEDGIQKKEIRNMDVDFISSLLLQMPMIFMKTELYTDEFKRVKLLENFFNFMKYGLLGGIESPKESDVLEEK